MMEDRYKGPAAENARSQSFVLFLTVVAVLVVTDQRRSVGINVDEIY